MGNNSTHSVDRSVSVLASSVYFVQGALGISGVAFPLFLRQKGWGIAQISTFSFVVALPWTLKLLYGSVSDAIPIGGFHRKPYIILASVSSALAWLGLVLFPGSVRLLYFFALIANLGFAVTDVVTDALIVEHSTESTTQFYQSLAWGFRSVGAIVGGVLGGWMAQNFPYRYVFLVTSTLPVVTMFVGFSVHEKGRSKEENPPDLLRPLVESLRSLLRGDLLWFSLFLLAGSFSASFSTPFFFFLKERLSFSETFLGSLSSLSWFGAVVGCYLYGKFLSSLELKRSLILAVVLNVVNILSTFLVINRWSAVILSILGGVLGYLSLLPSMAAAAVLARRKGIEGSLFALIMSVNNLGQILSTFMGGKLFDIIGLRALILLSAGVGLLGIVVISPLKTLGGGEADVNRL